MDGVVVVGVVVVGVVVATGHVREHVTVAIGSPLYSGSSISVCC